MKKYGYIYVCIIVLAAFIFSFTFVNIKIRKLQTKYDTLEFDSKKKSDSIVKIINVLQSANSVCNFKIEDCILWNTLVKDPVNLFSLLSDKSLTTIIRLSHTSCSSCTKKQMTTLIDNLSDCEDLLILSNVSNLRELRLFLRENKVKQTVYWIDSACNLFNDDDISKVLVMKVNKDGTILNSYYFDEQMLFLIKSVIR
ncbi:MAG: hypothetical protein LBG92_10875 [Prevotellaceae bacterium]|jgi:hypothetical protein|nr:hypothetical protein [Prevotellaceae bacterium]